MIRRMYIYHVAHQNVAANILNELISYKLKKWERASATITSQTRIAIERELARNQWFEQSHLMHAQYI